MASDVMDWDSAYRQEAGFAGPPPWNIGEPQPELAAIIGKLRSERGPERRWNELIAKADSVGLSDAEKAELMDLQRQSRLPGSAPGG